MLIAMDVEMMQNDAGIDNVVTAPSAAAEALRRLQDFTPDVAVLDVNLGAGTSAPVAQDCGGSACVPLRHRLWRSLDDPGRLRGRAVAAQAL